jgi:3-deoxy-D-manno-octulosonic acid (KDO) 8-phosphate synthase
VIIEVHPNPELALSDGPQALRPHEFAQLVADLRRIVPLVGKRVLRSPGAQPAPNPTHATEVIAP